MEGGKIVEGEGKGERSQIKKKGRKEQLRTFPEALA